MRFVTDGETLKRWPTRQGGEKKHHGYRTSGVSLVALAVFDKAHRESGAGTGRPNLRASGSDGNLQGPNRSHSGTNPCLFSSTPTGYDSRWTHPVQCSTRINRKKIFQKFFSKKTPKQIIRSKNDSATNLQCFPPLIDWFTAIFVYHFHWLIDWLSGRLIDWLIEWIDWVGD